MDDAVPVSIEERFGQLPQNPRRPRRLDPPLTLHQIAKTLARHEFHHEVEQTVRLSGRVHGDDVRMPQPRHRASLLEEACSERLRGAQLRRDHLDRDRAVQRQVATQKDASHAARA